MSAIVLITGMSGTGKSTVIAELARRGYRAVDLDTPAYSHLVPAEDGATTGIGGGMDWVWNVDRVRHLLDSAGDEPLFVSGCSPNQGKLYSRFNQVVLLTAPTEVIVERLRTRTTNDFGKDPDQLANTLALIEEVEPVLRRRAHVAIETTQPLGTVIGAIVQLLADCGE